MRKITEKDRQGAARALQVFMTHVSGQRRLSTKSLLEAVDRAVDEGISFDELLNRENYSRAAAVMQNATAMDYVNILATRQVVVRELTSDPEWDNQEAFGMVAEAFHAFYKEICPKGGTWNTPNAKLKLSYAIKLNSLQALMSEALINEVAEKYEEKGELTCFLYINEILQSPSKYNIDKTETERQMQRKEDEEESSVVPLKTEGESSELDESIFGIMNDEDAYEPNIDEMGFSDAEQFPDLSDFEDNSFIAYKDPREYKKGCVAGIIFALNLKEIQALMESTTDECSTIEDLVTALVDGKVDKEKESLEARQAHQYMRMELLTAYITCVRLQGIEINEENASEHDVLMSNWDMRDTKARKLQKLKQLIYDHGEKDDDLVAAIKDLEVLYQS